MAEVSGNSAVQFAPFSSAVDAAFWHRLTQKKLEVYQLDDKPKPLQGYYVNSDPAGLHCRFNLDYNAFSLDKRIPQNTFKMKGRLVNTNTVEGFRNCDKKELIHSVGQQIWESILSGQAVDDPSLLCKFVLITFADLKHYKFYYWFAFPALCPEVNAVNVDSPVALGDYFSALQIASLQSSYDSFVTDGSGPGFFLVKVSQDAVSVGHLREWDTFHSGSQIEIMVGFCDPCTMPENPGWPLRNFLALLACHWGSTKVTNVKILCWRDRVRSEIRESSHSLVMNVKLPSYSKTELILPKCVGWEKNKQQRLVPRMVDLSATMDPERLAASSVDLNLKLMKWRLLPSLDLEKISQTKCLLLGAGTLGCNVARCLLGWGVRTITLVDYGTISYSNPVRQTLFEFTDCQNGGKSKAETAASSLKRIFPGVDASSFLLSIPMPGHSVGQSTDETKKVKEDVSKLEELIETHDAVFLLMDTRESRWLPTVIAATKNKCVITAALGFDTFLVMRHGVRELGKSPCQATTGMKIIPGSSLGCYFCNDVVAPGDSTRDRTLDQQCTVSRPGMSYIASALAVELLVSITQHSLGIEAGADTSAKDAHLTADLDSHLGLLPHQIRGFLSRYHLVLPASFAFDKCIACSPKVLASYTEQGFSFLLKVFNLPSYLEDLTGLTQLMLDTRVSEVWEMSDDEAPE
ncbi:ubiquitin-like modifier-activating enzyme ATG7 [Acropora palmata]